MAIQEVSLALIAFIPGEILFGSLVDSACTLWNEVGCGKTGHCLDYNLPGKDASRNSYHYPALRDRLKC